MMKTMTESEDDLVPPDPEVVAGTVRRQFSAAYKRRIVEEAEACTEPGQIGALLRREGLYSSLLSLWRRKVKRSSLAGLEPQKRGRKPKHSTPDQKRVAELEKQVRQLERENARVEAKLKRADLMLDLQKKVSEILGIPLAPPPESDGGDS